MPGLVWDCFVGLFVCLFCYYFSLVCLFLVSNNTVTASQFYAVRCGAVRWEVIRTSTFKKRSITLHYPYMMLN